MINSRIKKPWLLFYGYLTFALAIVPGCTDTGTQLVELEHAPADFEESGQHTLVSALQPEGEEASRFEQVPQLEGSVVLGLDADMSSGSAASGEAIRRGVVLAVDKINQAGGLLGKPVEIIVRDHRGNPDRGKSNIREFAEMPNLLAVVGGIHTPVAIQELPLIHEKQVLYLGPWAAGTPIVANGYSPNFVFRVSVRDEYAGGFLVRQALERGHERIGLLLERTAWGRSNETAIVAALENHGTEPACIEWLNWGQKNLTRQAERLHKENVDAVILVTNPLEGAAAIKAIADLPESSRPPVISHWGISAGSFFEIAESELNKVELSFLQTFSFVKPKRPEMANVVFEAYRQKFDTCQTPADIFAPVGTAHAYEIVMMLAEATRKAGTLDSVAVLHELESLGTYQGLIRDYDSPFSPELHDALTDDDFFLAEYDENGTIWPAK